MVLRIIPYGKVCQLSHTRLSRPLVGLSSTLLLAAHFVTSQASPVERAYWRRPLPPPALRTTGPLSAVWVWAPPCSFATTKGMCLSSSGYLDVSVPPLTSQILWVPRIPPWWVAPFGYPRVVMGAQPLPVAYRSYATPFIGSSRLGIHRAPMITACPLPRPLGQN